MKVWKERLGLILEATLFGDRFSQKEPGMYGWEVFELGKDFIAEFFVKRFTLKIKRSQVNVVKCWSQRFLLSGKQQSSSKALVPYRFMKPYNFHIKPVPK